MRATKRRLTGVNGRASGGIVTLSPVSGVPLSEYASTGKRASRGRSDWSGGPAHRGRAVRPLQSGGFHQPYSTPAARAAMDLRRRSGRRDGVARENTGPAPLTDGLHQLLLYRKSMYWCSMGFLEVPSATRYQSAPSFLNRNDT